MKKVFKKINMRFLFAALFVTATLFSCSKWDDYKKYTANGEIIYSGKLDSVKTFSGKYRIRINGKLNVDPKISAVKIFWNNNADSVVYEINRSSTGDVFDQTFTMPESITTFTVYTYDADGNKSVPVNVVGKSYGDAYRRRLSNRLITNLSFTSTNTTINWEPMDMSTGAQYTEVEYVVDGETKHIVTPVSESSTVLEGLNTTTPIKFRTIFKPEATSIDTFAVEYQDKLIKVVPPLKNRKVPFIASEKSGRWGNLADWQSNAAVKNHGGYGGWDEWNSNIFNVESGWGSPAVTNGKIWQTLTLGPDNYTFEISDLMNTNLTDQDNAYLVVALGSDLPDVENINTALGYVKIVSGKPVGELNVKFSITQKSEVSLGYLTTQPDGNPGRFCNIRAFNFYAN